MTVSASLADTFRVLRQTNSVLEIENRPTRRAAIIAGGILLGASMGMAALADGAVGTGLIVLGATALIGGSMLIKTVLLTQLRLDRGDGTIRLRITGLRGQTEYNLPLDALERADPRTSFGQPDGAEKVALFLVMTPDAERTEIQVPLGGSDAEDVHRLAAFITDWLAGTSRKRHP